MNEQAAPKNDVMHKVACQIVERRDLIFLIVVILLIFSVISRSWVSVENDLTTYLPETSGTRQALDIMEEEFTTYGTADVMVANIGPERAQELADQLATTRKKTKNARLHWMKSRTSWRGTTCMCPPVWATRRPRSSRRKSTSSWCMLPSLWWRC